MAVADSTLHERNCLDAGNADVRIVIVNWNGWRDTILCLQSLLGMSLLPAEIIVCDNGSTDGSVNIIRCWAEGRLSAWVPPSHPARQAALCQRRPRRMTFNNNVVVGPNDYARTDLVLIETGENLGFGGGNNVGISHLRSGGSLDFIWLLNNDTTVAVDALRSLVECASADGTRVLASSRVMYMDRPDVVWFEGGVFDSVTATAKHVSQRAFERSSHGYLSGCALLIGRSVWESIGLLDAARFFMYGEDIDYSIRARAAGAVLRIAHNSTVLHAVSASSQIASPFAYRHNVAAGIRVSRKHFAHWRAIPIALFHTAKLAALAVAKRPGRAALQGYWRGIVMGFS